MDNKQSITYRLRLRNVARLFFRAFPLSMRQALYRRMIEMHEQPPAGFTFKTAESREELEQAYQILHDEYVRQNLMPAHPSGMRITPYHALPSTCTLIAKKDNTVVATVSIIRSSAFGTPIEKIYSVAQYKSKGERVAEISALAIKKGFRQNRGEILFPLLKYIYQYAIECFGVDYFIIAVHPRHFEFYQAILFFEKLNEKSLQNYTFVQGAPATFGILNLRKAHQTFAAYYGRKPRIRNLFRYFRELSFDSFVFPQRKYFNVSPPFMSADLLDYFFNKKTEVFKQLNAEELSILRSLYRNSKCLEVIPEGILLPLEKFKRSSHRFDVECSGRIKINVQKYLKIKVLNVSEMGFQAYLNKGLRTGMVMEAEILAGEFDIFPLTCLPMWQDGEGLYGFKIIETTPQWQKFIHELKTYGLAEDSLLA